MCQLVAGKSVEQLVAATPALEKTLNGQNRDIASAETYRKINSIYKAKRLKKNTPANPQLDQMAAELAETRKMLATMQKMLKDPTTQIRAESPNQQARDGKITMVDGIDVSHLPEPPMPGAAPPLETPVRIVDNRNKTQNANRDEDMRQ